MSVGSVPWRTGAGLDLVTGGGRGAVVGGQVPTGSADSGRRAAAGRRGGGGGPPHGRSGGRIRSVHGRDRRSFQRHIHPGCPAPGLARVMPRPL